MSTISVSSSKIDRKEWLGTRWLHVLLNMFRSTAHTVLEMLRPLVVLALGAASLVGFAICLFVAGFVRGAHFPMGATLLLSVGCVAAIVFYEALIFLTSKSARA